jgi:hypothetical protein
VTISDESTAPPGAEWVVVVVVDVEVENDEGSLLDDGCDENS